jgi:hypothetical protein
MRLFSRIAIALVMAVSMAPCRSIGAEDFKLEPVASIAAVPIEKLKPRTIIFSELRADKAVDAAADLVTFEDWARDHPLQQRFLSTFPEFKEPQFRDGRSQKLSMYVAEARFRMSRPAQAFDLSRYATIAFLEKLDPAITHRPLLPADAVPNKDTTSTISRPPDRRWCEDATACFQSHYKFEGRIPTGILLVNKLRDETKKPIPDFLEFQSEIRLLSPREPRFSDIKQLTGLDTAVAGALEQNIFWVNQVIHSGKILAVMQQDPADRDASIATIYLSLAIRSDVLGKQRDFRNAPILRNLVPAQLLMGRSSFNSGNSISAGLPVYARGRIKAIAAAIEQ